MLTFGVDATPAAVAGASPIPLLPARSWMTRSSAEVSPAPPEDCLNIEFDTREFLVTCLKLELVLRGDASNPCPGESGPSDMPGDFNGEPSRFAILRGDHPCAEELMMELRVAFAVECGEGRKLSRVCAEGDGCDMVLLISRLLVDKRYMRPTGNVSVLIATCTKI